MRIFLWFKWGLFAALFCASLVLAAPFVLVAVCTMPTKTRQFMRDLGGQHARNCAVDFSRLKGR